MRGRTAGAGARLLGVQTDARDALAVVAELGPFFAVATGPTGPTAPPGQPATSGPTAPSGLAGPPGLRPVRDLYTDPGPLRARLAHVRTVLGSDARTAASITFQGLAARVLSAPLAAAMLCDTVPLLTPDALHFAVTDDKPWPLWCADPDAVAVPDPDDAARTLADLLLAPHLEPLVAAVRAQVGVAPRLLWGNVASSVAAGKRLVTAHRPEAAQRAAAIVARLLDTGPLRDAGVFLPPRAPDRVWTFRRRSCCLYYRVPGGGLCGDCALDEPPSRA